MKTVSRHFWIYSLAAICVSLVLTGCERERFLEPELSSHEMIEGFDSQISPLSIPDGERFLIGFHKTPDINVVRGVGGEVYRTFTIVPAVAARLSPRAVEALEKHPNVRYVEFDHEVFAHSQTVPWGIDRVFGDEEYSFPTWGTTKGSGIGVAILDTGIDVNHEDLTVIGGVRFRTTGPILRQDDQYDDDNGHGTHVAGTVAALDNDWGVVGVGPEIGLYAVKVLDASGGGSVSSVVAGIEWAVTEGIPVLNMSLGSSSSNQTMQDACDNAYKAGHLLVASAGNSGNSDGTGDNVGYPAAYESVIAVAASDDNDSRASFSSTGMEVELIAPGSSIYSTLPGNKYGTYSGTSMASPHVAGAAALTWAANADLKNVQVREILQDTAEDLKLSEDHQGRGLVRADSAVAAVSGAEPPPPATTYTVSGTVSDDEGFLEGATVTIKETGQSDITLGDGTYSISDVEEGTYNITASKEGYNSKTENVLVQSDTEVDFVLEEVAVEGVVTVESINYSTSGGRFNDRHLDIELLLLDDLDNTVAGASVSATLNLDDVSSWNFQGTTGSDGTVTFTLNNHVSGCYDTVVTALAAEGLEWDGVIPENSYCK